MNMDSLQKTVRYLLRARSFFFTTLILNSTQVKSGNLRSDAGQWIGKNTMLQQARDEPFILKADQIRFDEKKDILSACGNVILKQSQHCLKTSHVDYHIKKKWICLTHPFSLTTQDGDLLLAQSAQLMEALQTGRVEKPRIFTRDRERINALRAIKKEGSQEFEMASYTPCAMCKDQLEPLWSVHARKIIRDEKNQTLDYTDAHLQFGGVPVAYAPHFHFPFKRKTGFLIPHAKSTKELGLFASIPYYWVINSSGTNDLSITPYLTAAGGTIVASEYRHALNHGSFSLKGAINFNASQNLPKSDNLKSIRGYARSSFKYDISSHWRLKSNEWWTSDSTFLSTRPFFGHTTDPFLESSTKLEGFYPRSFFEIKGLRYQNLQGDVDNMTPPFIYPSFVWVYTEPKGIGNTFQKYTFETLSLYEKQGVRMQRLNAEAHLQLPFDLYGHRVTPFFHIEKAFFHTSYHTTGKLIPENSPFFPYWEKFVKNQTYNAQRLFPQVGIDWDWSLAIPSIKLLIVPQAQCVLGLNRLNKLKIPNQDSLGVNFSDSVLFQANRFPGRDRVDEGSRLNYALNFKLLSSSQSNASFMIGQSYSWTQVSPDLEPFGVRKGFSDWVGRLEGFFSPWKSRLVYRFRIQSHPIRSKFQEVFAVLGPPKLNISGGYTFLVPDSSIIPERVFQGYNQIFGTLNAQITRCWSFKLFFTQNFSAFFQSRKLLDKGIGVTYQDECFTFQLNVQRSFYRLKDLRPGWVVDFNILFKNLGGLKQKFDRFSRIRKIED
jgi:LPS-assembly protein